MKKVLASLVVAGLTATFSFGQKVENRPVSDFTGINASGAFEITVVKGNTMSLAIEANDDTMPYVRSEVNNGVLHLYLENNAPKRVNSRTVKASIVMKDLDKVSLSGACKITANDLFTPERFKSDCSGSSNMTININTGQLSIKASGTSKIQITASVTGETGINVAGSSNIHGEMRVNNMKFNSSGSCEVNLTGSAMDVILDMAGASTFKAGDFTARTAVIKSSGSSNATVNVTDALNVNSAGASTVNYKGSPTITINSRGASKVSKI